MLLARYDAVGDSHYYHHDGLGSIMGLTDENKSVEQSYFYDEFGISLGSWGNVASHYLYTGQEYDGSITQLYNLRARYYKPNIGRFISEDPIPSWQNGCCFPRTAVPLIDLYLVLQNQPAHLNPYPYCVNNPLNYTDRNGLFPMSVSPECLAAIGLATGLWELVRQGDLYDKYAHCVAFCEINRHCGSLIAKALGNAVEIAEVITRRGRFDPADLEANARGMQAPCWMSCWEWCDMLYGQGVLSFRVALPWP